LKHLKTRCAGCERASVPMNKEHVFPQWLILRCRAHQTGIRWGDNPKLPALRATLPLCVDCNSVFGRELESPARATLDDLEARRGITDEQAELLVRWMWKIKGLAWIANHPGGDYTKKYTLRERVIRPIDEIRGDIVFAAALVDALHPESTDLPMGMNVYTELDAVFVAGVFSRVAMMAVLASCEESVPSQYARFRLAPRRDEHTSMRLFHPPLSLTDDVEAVGVSYLAGLRLSAAHDNTARSLLDR
jgi:hypothetical protein